MANGRIGEWANWLFISHRGAQGARGHITLTSLYGAEGAVQSPSGSKNTADATRYVVLCAMLCISHRARRGHGGETYLVVADECRSVRYVVYLAQRGAEGAGGAACCVL